VTDRPQRRGAPEPAPGRIAPARWFELTERERLLLLAVLAVLLLGLVARYIHLRRLGPVPYTPAGLAAEPDAGEDEP
jgi:hypothetical protein